MNNEYYQPSVFDGTSAGTLEQSLQLIKEFEPVALARNPRGYIVGYSGGKDSDVLVSLFRRAGVKFMVMHNHTTIDAPETVYYIRKKFAKWTEQGIPCKIYYPDQSFWRLCLHKKFLPMRNIRFCCSSLKERDIPELKFAVHSFGVRKAESSRRAKFRDSIEMRDHANYSDNQRFHFDNTDEVKQTDACFTKNYLFVNPLAYWADNYLWEYIRAEKIEINPLYEQGFCRVGCIGCPMAGKRRIEEFKRWPQYEKMFVRLCDKIIEIRNAQGLKNKYGLKNGREYFEYWLYNELPQGETIFDLEAEK